MLAFKKADLLPQQAIQDIHLVNMVPMISRQEEQVTREKYNEKVENNFVNMKFFLSIL